MIKVIQLPSRHLLKDGKYHIEYNFQVEGVGYFSDLATLWNDAVSSKEVNLSEDGKVATYLEQSNNRAVKYTEENLKFIFEGLLVSGLRSRRTTITPEQYQVSSY